MARLSRDGGQGSQPIALLTQHHDSASRTECKAEVPPLLQVPARNAEDIGNIVLLSCRGVPIFKRDILRND
jgi:hypothetical protein